MLANCNLLLAFCHLFRISMATQMNQSNYSFCHIHTRQSIQFAEVFGPRWRERCTRVKRVTMTLSWKWHGHHLPWHRRQNALIACYEYLTCLHGLAFCLSLYVCNECVHSLHYATWHNHTWYLLSHQKDSLATQRKVRFSIRLECWNGKHTHIKFAVDDAVSPFRGTFCRHFDRRQRLRALRQQRKVFLLIRTMQYEYHLFQMRISFTLCVGSFLLLLLLFSAVILISLHNK